MKCSFVAWVVCVTVGLVCTVGSTRAERGRTLGGYRFVPVTAFPDPFAVSRFRNYTGVAYANNIEFPLLVIDTEPPDTLLSLNGNYLFVVANFRFQWAVHPRVAVGLSAQGASRVGTSGQALLSQGVTALTGISLDGTFELWQSDRVLLSLVAEADYTDALDISFTRFVEDIIDGNIRNASLVRVVDGFWLKGGLGTAWAFNGWSGITGSVNWGFPGWTGPKTSCCGASPRPRRPISVSAATPRSVCP
jgi:hypothetical protein